MAQFEKNRSSPPEADLGKDVLKICSRFTGEHPSVTVISIKLLCNVIEITLQHRCSPVNLLHIFRAPFPKYTYLWRASSVSFYDDWHSIFFQESLTKSLLVNESSFSVVCVNKKRLQHLPHVILSVLLNPLNVKYSCVKPSF